MDSNIHSSSPLDFRLTILRGVKTVGAFLIVFSAFVLAGCAKDTRTEHEANGVSNAKQEALIDPIINKAEAEAALEGIWSYSYTWEYEGDLTEYEAKMVRREDGTFTELTRALNRGKLTFEDSEDNGHWRILGSKYIVEYDTYSEEYKIITITKSEFVYCMLSDRKSTCDESDFFTEKKVSTLELAKIPEGFTRQKKERTDATYKAIIHNLRQFWAAATVFYEDSGKSLATYDELIGPGLYVLNLYPVNGESYKELVVDATTENLKVIDQNGDEYVYDPPGDNPFGAEQ